MRSAPRNLDRPEPKVITYKAGRVCAHPDCDTILSVYNPQKRCAEHDDAIPRKRRYA